MRAAIIGVAVAPLTAQAQTLTRKTDVTLQARVAHDSNVGLGNAAQSALIGIKPSDTLYTPTATVDVFVPISRQSLFLKGGVSYDFHQINQQLDRAHADLTGGINLTTGPCQSTVSLSYARAQADLQVLALADPRNTYDTEKANFITTCGRASGLAATFSASAARGNNSNRFQAVSDSRTKSYTAGLIYRRPSLGTLQVFGSHTNTEYPDRLIVAGASRGFDLDALGVTYERNVGSRLNAKLSASNSDLKSLTSLAGGGGNFNSTTYSADLRYRPTAKLALDLHHSRSIEPALEIGRLYNLQQQTSLGASYQVGTRITLAGSVAKGRIDSKGVLPVGGVLLTNSETKSGTVSVRYRQSSKLSFLLDAAREDRRTNIANYDYSSDRVGLTAVLGF